MTIRPFTLRDFVRESNRIEGIGTTTRKQVWAHEDFLSQWDGKSIEPIQTLVNSLTRHNGPLRSEPGMDVVVGKHRPPLGGPDIPIQLTQLLERRSILSAHTLHNLYETLHPFMDGNGRSGRAIWLWKMGGIEGAPLGFLHHYYYQTLDAWR